MSINNDTLNDNLMDKALSLPTDARLELVDKLLNSLNPPFDKEVEQLWIKEAEKRITQLERGEASLVSGAEVFARVRDKYRK